MFRKKSKLSFADVAVSNRNIRNVFLETVEKHINWEKIEEIISKNYTKGKRADGRPAFRGLVLFKMCLLQEWYGLTARRIEAMVNDSVSMSHFLEQSLDEKIPSAATFMNFKREMIKKGVYQELQAMISDDLTGQSLSIRKGTIKQPYFIRNISRPAQN